MTVLWYYYFLDLINSVDLGMNLLEEDPTWNWRSKDFSGLCGYNKYMNEKNAEKWLSG